MFSILRPRPSPTNDRQAHIRDRLTIVCDMNLQSSTIYIVSTVCRLNGLSLVRTPLGPSIRRRGFRVPNVLDFLLFRVKHRLSLAFETSSSSSSSQIKTTADLFSRFHDPPPPPPPSGASPPRPHASAVRRARLREALVVVVVVASRRNG